jgi:hypothetical protein
MKIGDARWGSLACWSLAACAVMASGCEEDFEPYARLSKLRVLAIRNEPVRPAPGETTVMTPLVYVPGDQAVSYAWSWCPFPGNADDGYTCPVNEDFVNGLQPPGSPPVSFGLGTGPTASFTHAFAPESLAMLCQEGQDAATMVGAGALAAFLPDCRFGFPIQVTLVVTAGGTSLKSITTVRLRLADTEPNMNPAISGLNAVFNWGEAPIDEGGLQVLSRRTETPLKAVVTEAEAEPYTEKDDRGNPMPARERIYLSWFVEAGDVGDERTTFIPGELPIEGLLENKWTPAGEEDYPNRTSRIWVVARDNRGGIGWIGGIVTLRIVPP